jgi:hypothetical protein
VGLLSTLGTIGGSLFGGPVGGAIGGALGGLVEGNDQANAAQAAAGQTAAATNQATALQREMWMAQQEQQKPWLQAGTGAINRLAAGLGRGGEFATPFSQTNWQQDPGYAFRLSEGQKALERSAAARGGLISGSALKAAQRYGQQAASDEYQNAFNRYYNERNQMLSPLQSLAGVGQNAANTLGTAGTNYASNVGNALINQGYAAGNAGIAGANARQSMYGNIGSALGQVPSSQWSSLGSSIGNWYNNLGNTNVPGGSSWGMDLGQ